MVEIFLDGNSPKKNPIIISIQTAPSGAEVLFTVGTRLPFGTGSSDLRGRLATGREDREPPKGSKLEGKSIGTSGKSIDWWLVKHYFIWPDPWDDCIFEQLHLFTMKTTTCGVKQGLWKCWFRLQNEVKTRWGDSKNEVALNHFKTRLKRGHSWWKRGHSWWKSAETWKTRLKRGGGPSLLQPHHK